MKLWWKIHCYFFYLQISFYLLTQITIKYRILPKYNCIISIVNEEKQLRHTSLESTIILDPRFKWLSQKVGTTNGIDKKKNIIFIN